MGAAQEAVVTRFMEAWGDGTIAEPDVETIVAMFTEDAVWQLWIPGGPTLRGREAIRKDIARQVTFARFMRCGPIHVTSNDRVVFTERLDTFRSGDVTVEHALVAVFEVEPDGLISAWREYFDPGDVNRQLKAAKAVVPRADV
ncbi:MAG: limonene-1,2-epoxide hydrolase family protein [Acidimicrobiia bacterium]